MFTIFWIKFQTWFRLLLIAHQAVAVPISPSHHFVNLKNLNFVIHYFDCCHPPHDDDEKPPLGKDARQAQPSLPSALLRRWICDKNFGHWEKRRLWGWQHFMMHLIFDFLPISISIKYFEDVFDFLICLHPEMRICFYINLKHPARAQQIQYIQVTC